MVYYSVLSFLIPVSLFLCFLVLDHFLSVYFAVFLPAAAEAFLSMMDVPPQYQPLSAFLVIVKRKN